jgi:hypothetical protein
VLCVCGTTTTNLQDLGERLHDPGVLVAVRLHRVDESDLRLGARTKRLDDRREALRSFTNGHGSAVVYSG